MGGKWDYVSETYLDQVRMGMMEMEALRAGRVFCVIASQVSRKINDFLSNKAQNHRITRGFI